DVERFFALLHERGVRALDLRPLLETTKKGEGACYLPRDTHWTPRAMAEAARDLALEISSILSTPSDGRPEVAMHSGRIRARGDLVEMLRLPEGADAFPAEELDLEVPDSLPARAVADLASPILLIGDSFTRVFSDAALGLGEGAGLGEHLAAELARPIDVIALSGGGARAVREALARRASLPAEEGG